MNQMTRRMLLTAASLFTLTGLAAADDAKLVTIEIKTSQGVITAELNKEKAPLTVENFLKYIAKDHYNGTVFHRVIEGFMIQGGGFAKTGAELVEKESMPPVRNEGGNGLKNEVGTLAMARTNDPDSATAQFFINTVNNDFLNQNLAGGSAGYAVFGKVTKGLEVVNTIKAVPTATRSLTMRTPGGATMSQPAQNVPVTDVIIESIKVVAAAAATPAPAAPAPAATAPAAPAKAGEPAK
jgi:cyclophilin family peptidyl-prolyl cis-trans isomerase